MKQIVIISGKGGTGKTMLTSSFAALSKNGVFADCDVDAADLHILLEPKIIERHKFKGGKTAFINKKTFVVINKYDLNIEMSEEIEKYCQKNKIPLAGKIVYDSIVPEAIANKRIVVEYSKGEIVKQIKNIWQIIYNALKLF